MKTKQDRYIDLILAAQTGDLKKVVGYGSGATVYGNRWSGAVIRDRAHLPFAQIEWQRNNFDFGYLLSRGHDQWIGDTEYDHLLKIALEEINTGRGFMLPFTSCAYVFRCQEDVADYKRTYCILLDQDSSGMRGMSFIRQDAPVDNPARSWTKECAEFNLGEGGEFSLELIAEKPAVADMIEMSFFQLINDVLVASMLLSRPKEYSTKMTSEKWASRCRASRSKMTSQFKIPTVVRISIENSLMFSAATRSGSTAPRVGHVRRAHIRVLWRGTDRQREIKVKSSIINGGGDNQDYVVK